MITFDKLNFSDPILLSQWNPPALAGLYVILKQDVGWQPKPFSPIYFGEAGNYSERGFPSSHHKFTSWLRACGSSSQIYVSICPMPNSTPEQRRRVESVLCNRYNPPCNG